MSKFTNMNKLQKEIWIRMRNIFNILDLNKYKKSTVDDLRYLWCDIDYIHRNRYLLEGNKFSVWKSFIDNNLLILINIFLHDISVEFDNSCNEAKKTRITRSMAAIHMNNTFDYKRMSQEILEKVNEICENNVRRSSRISQIEA